MKTVFMFIAMHVAITTCALAQGVHDVDITNFNLNSCNVIIEFRGVQTGGGCGTLPGSPNVGVVSIAPGSSLNISAASVNLSEISYVRVLSIDGASIGCSPKTIVGRVGQSGCGWPNTIPTYTVYQSNGSGCPACGPVDVKWTDGPAGGTAKLDFY